MIYNIPKNYRINNNGYRPVLMTGLDHFMYVNSNDLITDADFDDWTVSLYQNSTEIQTDVATLTKDIISGSDYRFYMTVNIDVSVLNGEYYLVVYNSLTDEVKFQGNCIYVISEDEIENYVYLQYRNSSNIFNINYGVFSEYQNIFLDMNVIDEQPEIEVKTYTEVSTGKIRNQLSNTAKVLTLESYYFDDGANDMMLALSVHDDILINGKVVKVKTPYKIETSLRDSLQRGVIEFYDQEFSTVNYNN